jgi:hypothetical protein
MKFIVVRHTPPNPYVLYVSVLPYPQEVQRVIQSHYSITVLLFLATLTLYFLRVF